MRRIFGALVLAAALFGAYGGIGRGEAGAGELPGEYQVYGGTPHSPPVRVYSNGKKDYNPYYQKRFKDDLPGLVDAINRDYPPFRGGRSRGW